jgi:hypothetical protein
VTRINPVQQTLKRADFFCPTHSSPGAYLWSLLNGTAQSLPHSSRLAPSFRPPTQPPYIHGSSEFQLIISALKIETARFYETVASIKQSTRRLKPKEHHHQNSYRRENLKPHTEYSFDLSFSQLLNPIKSSQAIGRVRRP